MILALAALALGGSIKTDVADPYVEIRTPHGLGAGTVIEVDGELLVLTAAHVAEGCRFEREGSVFSRPARLVNKKAKIAVDADVVLCGRRGDIGPDLALLKPRDTAGLAPASLTVKFEYDLGEDCWYIGSPAGAHARLEKSIISGIDADDIEGFAVGSYITTNGSGWYGSSGGGLFVKRSSECECCGESEYVLAGVVVAGDMNRGNPVSWKYAVDHQTIQKFLDLYRESKGGYGR